MPKRVKVERSRYSFFCTDVEALFIGDFERIVFASSRVNAKKKHYLDSLQSSKITNREKSAVGFSLISKGGRTTNRPPANVNVSLIIQPKRESVKKIRRL